MPGLATQSAVCKPPNFSVTMAHAASVLGATTGVCPRWIVVTDLDGTLLDSQTYRPELLSPVLARLADLKVPIVMSTSKTRAEVEDLRSELGNSAPFIVENGAAIFFPSADFPDAPSDWDRRDGYVVLRLSEPIEAILDMLEPLRVRYRFRGFSDLKVEALCRMTGLKPHEAANAKRRDFGEPVIWEDTEAALHLFIAEVVERGFKVQRGGRFLHVSGGSDKGRALRLLRAEYQNRLRAPTRIIALGDSDNDSEMLNAADLSVVIASPFSQTPSVDGVPAMVSARTGPRGWSDVMSRLAGIYEVRNADG